MVALKLSQTLNKAYRQLKITAEEFAKFQHNLNSLLTIIDDKESEENT